MHIHFLGTGSAFTQRNWQTNFLIRAQGKRLLIDCGSDIRRSLAEAGYGYRDLDAVYISHQHADHIGGMEWLAFLTYFDPDCGKLPIYVAQDVDLWDNHLKESLTYLVGRLAEHRDYFDWQELLIPATVDSDVFPEPFEFGHLKMEPVPVWHVVGEIQEPGYSMRSFGLRISGKEEPNVFWTSDTIYHPDHLMEHYEWADWILHDCETIMVNEGHPVNCLPIRSNVHPHFLDLADLPDRIKKKMLLIHYQDNVLNKQGRVSQNWKAEAKRYGFNRFVEKGEELVL